MITFMGIAVGVLIGAFLGATGMYLFIKENALDAVLERRAKETGKVTVYLDGEQIDGIKSELKRDTHASAPDIEEDTLEMPQEVKYGDF
jgi:hypothetical protein